MIDYFLKDVSIGSRPGRKQVQTSSFYFCYHFHSFTPLRQRQREMVGEGREAETVCVTGGSGFIGSWIVRLLLQRGYSVHATVKNLDDKAETDHLRALDGASERLKLFAIDLLDAKSLYKAIEGTVGVLHLASPCIVDRVHDPQSQLLDPAVKGTLNVLRAATEIGAKRVVITSSISAIVPSPDWPADKVKDESCWTDVEYCKKNEVWYPASKTLAEKAAWEFSKENGLDIVVINPGTVMGPIIPPSINASMLMLARLLEENGLDFVVVINPGMVMGPIIPPPITATMLMLVRLLEGCAEEYADIYMGPVHVEDVALAHILLYENPSASGRHLCVESIAHWSDFAAKVAELYPHYKVPKLPKDTQPGLVRAKDPAKKLIALGVEFKSTEKIIKDSMESLKSTGYIS